MKVVVAAVVFLFCLSVHTSANEIDSLGTDEEVEAFVVSRFERLKGARIGAIDLVYNFGRSRSIADSLEVRPWTKADFNNDGRTDILVTAKHHSVQLLFAIVTDGEEGYRLSSLNRGLAGNLFYPVVDTLDGDWILVLHEGRQWEFPRDKRGEIVRTDTLAFRFGGFVERPAEVRSCDITGVEYSTSPCYGNCPAFELEISGDRTAGYNAKLYDEDSGRFTTTLDTLHYRLLIDLLNFIDFPNLEDRYSVDWTDDQSSTLKITYNGGTTKTIHDYGLIGTYGLIRVYDILFDLRKNQDWK